MSDFFQFQLPTRVVAGEQALAGLADEVKALAGTGDGGCRVLLVSYGYSEGRDVRTLDSDGVMESLAEAADLLLA